MALKAKKVKAVEANSPATWSVAKFSSFYTQNRSELIAHANRIVKDVAQSAPAAKTISVADYADHMSLSLAQLETVTLMLAVLDQTDGGPAPTE
jgi:hypothetical protein